MCRWETPAYSRGRVIHYQKKKEKKKKKAWVRFRDFCQGGSPGYLREREQLQTRLKNDRLKRVYLGVRGGGGGRSSAGIRRKDQFASMGGGSQKAEPERPAGGAGALEPQAHQD